MNDYPHRIRCYKGKDLNSIAELWIEEEYFKGITLQTLKDHLRWKYSPVFTTLWVALKGSQVIGSCGIIGRKLYGSKGQEILGQWGIDSLVKKNKSQSRDNLVFFRVFRKALYDAFRKKVPFLGFCFPNGTVRRTYETIGWKNCPIFKEYSLELQSDDCVQDSYPSNFGYKGIILKKISKFEAHFDKVLASISKQYSLVGERCALYLNWRYFSAPLNKYSCFISLKNNKITGFFVLKDYIAHGEHHGAIVDFLLPPRNKRLFNDATCAILEMFRMIGVRYVHVHLTFKPYQVVLSNMGFFSNDIAFLVFGKDEQLLKRLLAKKETWFFTAGDGDFEMES